MDTRFLSPTSTPGPTPGAPAAPRPRRRLPRPDRRAPAPGTAPADRAAPATAPALDALRAVAVLVEPLPLWLAVRADPTLARAPLVVHDEGQVVHANPTARRLGVTQGMRLDGARLRVPGLEAIASHEPSLAQGWRELLRELGGWTPWLETGRRGRAFLRLAPAEAAELAARTGARVGVADDLETAELAALAGFPGRTRVVAEGDGAAFLERLPLRFLRGVGLPERERTRLRWLGLATVGDLARWTPGQLQAYLGDLAEALTPYLHGPRRQRVAAWRPPTVLRRSLAFERPLFEPHELEPALDRLARSLALDLAGRAAQHVTVATEGAGGARSATRIAKRPLHRAGQIRQQALFALRDSGAAGTAIDALTVELTEPARFAEAAGLWDARADRARAVDAVLERYPRALVHVRWHDPYAPAADLAWGWAALEDAAAPASAQAHAGDRAAPAAERRPTRTPARTPARAAGVARRALEAPLGAVPPDVQHAAPPLLAQPEHPLRDAPLRAHDDAPPDRPLSPAEGDRWAQRHADGLRRPDPLSPVDPLHDPDLVRAERWPGDRRAA